MKQPAPKLDQLPLLPLFDIKKRGGYRGAHRQKGAGSTVMRIPNEILSAVTELIETHKRSPAAIPPFDWSTSESINKSLKDDLNRYLKSLEERNPHGFLDKYINPRDPNEYWSGRGRKPMWINQYLIAGQKIPDELLNPNPVMPIVKRSK